MACLGSRPCEEMLAGLFKSWFAVLVVTQAQLPGVTAFQMQAASEQKCPDTLLVDDKSRTFLAHLTSCRAFILRCNRPRLDLKPNVLE